MSVLFVSILVGIVFLLQSIFGFLQVKNFTNTFKRMNQKGKVLIGKNPKKVHAGTILLLNIDDQARILDSEIMKGVSVLARFKEFNSLKGKSLPELAASYDQLHQYDKLTRQCILNAYGNYVNFKTGKLSAEDETDHVSPFSLPVFSLIKDDIVMGINRLRKRVN